MGKMNPHSIWLAKPEELNLMTFGKQWSLKTGVLNAHEIGWDKA